MTLGSTEARPWDPKRPSRTPWRTNSPSPAPGLRRPTEERKQGKVSLQENDHRLQRMLRPSFKDSVYMGSNYTSASSPVGGYSSPRRPITPTVKTLRAAKLEKNQRKVAIARGEVQPVCTFYSDMTQSSSYAVQWLCAGVPSLKIVETVSRPRGI